MGREKDRPLRCEGTGDGRGIRDRRDRAGFASTVAMGSLNSRTLLAHASRATLLFLVLACAGACSETTDSPLFSVLRFASTDARLAAYPSGSASGPLLVDPEIEEGDPRDATSLGLDSASLSRHLGALQWRREREAIQCDADPKGDCWVRENGVFLRIRSARRVGRSWHVIVQSSTTLHLPRGVSAVCPRTHEVVTSKASGEWQVAETRLLTFC
jgi:hypothetical protein